MVLLNQGPSRGLQRLKNEANSMIHWFGLKALPIDCIVPFFNENTRVETVVYSLLQSTLVNQIICVDDGSINPPKFTLKDKRLHLIRHPNNRGKTAAIRTGLQYVKTPYVCLCDADLKGLTSQIVDTCIGTAIKSQSDMFIMRLTHTMYITQLMRLDMLFSGQRIVRTNILLNALAEPIVGYQLETALNRVSIRQNLMVTYADVPISQYRKKDKRGLITGIRQDIEAARQTAAYLGLGELLSQAMAFKPKRLMVRL
jgi:glycosyltransferase involved in cell wall biosynthesis